MSAATLDCDAPSKETRAVYRGAEILRRGGLVVFPTETVYGLGAAVSSERAEAGVARLREVKQRSRDKPFTVHLPDPEAMGRYLDLEQAPLLERLARKTMPGPITFIADVPEQTMRSKVAEMGLPESSHSLLYHNGTIGLRSPDHPVAAKLLGAVDSPVVASSANLAGRPAPYDAQTAAALEDRADLILDGGRSRYARPSTIVRITQDRAEVVREGVFDQRYIDKLLQRVLIFVCSGNTCRSPMAAAIARDEAARRLDSTPDGLREVGVDILSAGVFAASGAPMAPEAAQALGSVHVPVSEHASQPLSIEMIRRADAVFCMTETHRRAAIAMAPAEAGSISLLDSSGDVEDPLGAGAQTYVLCAERLRELIGARLDEMNI